MGDQQHRHWYRFQRDRLIGGVLSGLGWYLHVHPALPRGIALLLFFGALPVPQLSGLVVLGYAAAWALLHPVPDSLEPENPPLVRGLYRPPKQRVLAGVCLGVAHCYKLDVRLVRVVTLALAMAGGVGILAYLAGWLLMPSLGQDSSEV